jgi:hypothetical protein
MGLLTAKAPSLALSSMVIPALMFPGTGKEGVVRDGLIGWWKFDEGAGLVVVDYSGKNNQGTLVNAPVWTPGGITFDGTNWVDCGNDSILALTTGVTLQAAMQHTGAPGGGYGRIISREGNYGMTLTTAGNLRFFSSTSDAVLVTQTLGLNTPAGLAVTASDTQFKGYLDGVLRATVTAGSNNVASAAVSLKLGNRADGARGIVGSIYYALLYNRVLTAEGVAIP